MALLTLSLVGLQFTWGIEMTYCTPYLLQLGLTKSRMSLVWIAGPLSGLIMQPIVGVITDRSRSKWGRRRPFMIGGSIVVAACLLVLGWTSEIVGMYVQDAETVGGETQHLYLYSTTKGLSSDGITSLASGRDLAVADLTDGISSVALEKEHHHCGCGCKYLRGRLRD
jgi:MFS family permease